MKIEDIFGTGGSDVALAEFNDNYEDLEVVLAEFVNTLFSISIDTYELL